MKKDKFLIKQLMYENACLKVEKLLWYEYMLNKQLDGKSLQDIKRDLKDIKFELEYLHKFYNEKDTRSGYETYGYNNLESVKSNLKNISDRWKCQFRIRWLLDLLNISFEG